MVLPGNYTFTGPTYSTAAAPGRRLVGRQPVTSVMSGDATLSGTGTVGAMSVGDGGCEPG